MPSVQCHFADNITWNDTPCDYKLAGNIDVWRLRLSANLHLVDDLTVLLNAGERNRASRYLHERDSQRFIISRAALRLLLAKYLNEHPKDINFSISGNKKPGVDNDGPLQYNTAHSGNLVLIAVADTPVGIDVEHISESFDYADVLPTCFSNEEAAYIQSHGRESFYRCWTRKEALVKATGKGMDNDLLYIPCLDGSHNVAADILKTDQNLSVMSFDAGAGYAGSVAHNTSVKDLVFRDIGTLDNL